MVHVHRTDLTTTCPPSLMASFPLHAIDAAERLADRLAAEESERRPDVAYFTRTLDKRTGRSVRYALIGAASHRPSLVHYTVDLLD